MDFIVRFLFLLFDLCIRFDSMAYNDCDPTTYRCVFLQKPLGFDIYIYIPGTFFERHASLVGSRGAV